MTQFNWSVDYLKKYSSVDEHSDIVYAVGYICTGINTSGILTNRYGAGGSVGLSTESLDSPVAYESLTEDIVQGWISAIKSDVQIKVEANINGGDDTPIEVMPWD